MTVDIKQTNKDVDTAKYERIVIDVIERLMALDIFVSSSSSLHQSAENMYVRTGYFHNITANDINNTDFSSISTNYFIHRIERAKSHM